MAMSPVTASFPISEQGVPSFSAEAISRSYTRRCSRSSATGRSAPPAGCSRSPSGAVPSCSSPRCSSREPASFHQSACRLDTCEFQLETFELQVDDFEVDSLSFTDVSVSLAAPTTGLINNGVIGMPENQMRLTATFRLTAEGEPQFGGEPVSVVLRNSGVAEMLLLPDSTLAIQKLDVSSWPFKMRLVSEVSL